LAVPQAWPLEAAQSVWLPWLQAVLIRLIVVPMLVPAAVLRQVRHLTQFWDPLLMRQAVAVAVAVLPHLLPVPRP
jgi:hypothetical protein